MPHRQDFTNRCREKRLDDRKDMSGCSKRESSSFHRKGNGSEGQIGKEVRRLGEEKHFRGHLQTIAHRRTLLKSVKIVLKKVSEDNVSLRFRSLSSRSLSQQQQT